MKDAAASHPHLNDGSHTRDLEFHNVPLASPSHTLGTLFALACHRACDEAPTENPIATGMRRRDWLHRFVAAGSANVRALPDFSVARMHVSRRTGRRNQSGRMR